MCARVRVCLFLCVHVCHAVCLHAGCVCTRISMCTLCVDARACPCVCTFVCVCVRAGVGKYSAQAPSLPGGGRSIYSCEVPGGLEVRGPGIGGWGWGWGVQQQVTTCPVLMPPVPRYLVAVRQAMVGGGVLVLLISWDMGASRGQGDRGLWASLSADRGGHPSPGAYPVPGWGIFLWLPGSGCSLRRAR